jgi:hypothetical protein
MHPGCETSMHYFLCSGGIGMDLRKPHGTRFAELVFLHPVGSASYVVHFTRSGAKLGIQHIVNLCNGV